MVENTVLFQRMLSHYTPNLSQQNMMSGTMQYTVPHNDIGTILNIWHGSHPLIGVLEGQQYRRGMWATRSRSAAHSQHNDNVGRRIRTPVNE